MIKTSFYCGCCDIGTDEDFNRYAVQVQNGEGYYGADGSYHSYHLDEDEDRYSEIYRCWGD